MKTLRRTIVAGAVVLMAGGLAAPVASAAVDTRADRVHEVGIQRTWYATVQCQIVRISDNHVVKYDRADGSGNTKEKAVNDAARNIPVPAGHYKRHCDTKRVW
ncbi:hypothetical protein ACWD6I_08340 [Streptomyces sp. NPDC002454]